MKVYIGIDWSENKHEVCFLAETGEVVLTQSIAHTIAGFRQLDQARQSLGIDRQEVILGLETVHNLLVDYLWDQGYERIYVLPPKCAFGKVVRKTISGMRTSSPICYGPTGNAMLPGNRTCHSPARSERKSVLPSSWDERWFKMAIGCGQSC